MTIGANEYETHRNELGAPRAVGARLGLVESLVPPFHVCHSSAAATEEPLGEAGIRGPERRPEGGDGGRRLESFDAELRGESFCGQVDRGFHCVVSQATNDSPRKS